jgi:hypothetical protein
VRTFLRQPYYEAVERTELHPFPGRLSELCSPASSCAWRAAVGRGGIPGDRCGAAGQADKMAAKDVTLTQLFVAQTWCCGRSVRVGRRGSPLLRCLAVPLTSASTAAVLLRSIRVRGSCEGSWSRVPGSAS